MSVAATLPVGSIVAFAADTEIESNLPKGWLFCNGQSLSTTEFPDLFLAIGHSNDGSGSGEDTFKLPDLRGRFIRGSTNTWRGGNQLFWQTAAPKTGAFNVQLWGIPDNNSWTWGGGGNSIAVWNGGDWYRPVIGGDKETRPVNTALNYVIKVIKGPTGQDDAVPIGAVIPFAGGANKAPPFPNYIRCDGSSVARAKIQNLAAIVGDVFAATPSNDTWYAPDLSGKFLRGVDQDGINDPDAGSRNPAPNGNSTGVGTWQPWATGLRGPNVNIYHLTQSGTQSYKTLGRLNLKNENYISDQDWTGGDVETRPSNAAVYFYINSRDATDPQTFPIGGIVGIPGNPTNPPNSEQWKICDGSSLTGTNFPALFKALGQTWGGSGDQFNLPDFTGWYLRGADVKGVANGDPERNNRFAKMTGGSRTGPGSYQNWATAMPRTGLKLDVSYPYDREENSLASGDGNNSSRFNGSQTTFTMNAAWDPETAPNTVVVQYWIRCK